MRLVLPLVALMLVAPAFTFLAPAASACDVYVRNNVCFHDNGIEGDCVERTDYDATEVRVGPYAYNAGVHLVEGCDSTDARDEWVLYRVLVATHIVQKFAYVEHYWHKQDGAVTECRTTLTVYDGAHQHFEFGCPAGPLGPTGLLDDRVPTLPGVPPAAEAHLLGALLQPSYSGTSVGSTAL